MSPIIQDSHLTVYCADALAALRELPPDSVQCCVTSPPYWGLRDYGVAGQIGLEETLAEFIQKIRAVFEEVRRALKPDGTCWVNMGDAYAGSWGAQGREGTTGAMHGRSVIAARQIARSAMREKTGSMNRLPGLKPKDLIGIPWRVAFALQDAGWYLRSDIIWHKPNPMPESITDRPTKAHEYLFLLSKSERYFYDVEASKEPVTGNAHPRGDGVHPKARWKTPDGWDTSKGNGGHGTIHRGGREKGKQNESFSAAVKDVVCTRNKRSVWTIPTAAFSDAHFATFPPDLVKPCILAGTKPGDTVLDPFGGSGTTGQVALELGRRAILIEINPYYLSMIKSRTTQIGFQFH